MCQKIYVLNDISMIFKWGVQKPYSTNAVIVTHSTNRGACV